MIEIDGPAPAAAPGSTVIVTWFQRVGSDVVRVPNPALTFRPSADVLEATGQEDLLDFESHSGSSDDWPRRAHGWRYEQGRFIPVEVHVGHADDRWTELVSGPLAADDLLVIRAGLAGSRR